MVVKYLENKKKKRDKPLYGKLRAALQISANSQTDTKHISNGNAS